MHTYVAVSSCGNLSGVVVGEGLPTYLPDVGPVRLPSPPPPPPPSSVCMQLLCHFLSSGQDAAEVGNEPPAGVCPGPHVCAAGPH